MNGSDRTVGNVYINDRESDVRVTTFPRRHPGSYWLLVTFLSIHPRRDRTAAPHRSPPKRNRNVSSRVRNATEKRAETSRRRRHPIASSLSRWRTNRARASGRASASGRALVSLRLFIYCCAKHRARRACDARVEIRWRWSPPWTQRRPRARWAARLGVLRGLKLRHRPAPSARPSSWPQGCRCHHRDSACWAPCRWCTIRLSSWWLRPTTTVRHATAVRHLSPRPTRPPTSASWLTIAGRRSPHSSSRVTPCSACRRLSNYFSSIW